MQQQDLITSTHRNLQERIKAIQEHGDGYVTVADVTDLEKIIQVIREGTKTAIVHHNNIPIDINVIRAGRRKNANK